MPAVDFGNVFLRRFLADVFLPLHRERLGTLATDLAVWAAAAREETERPLAAVFDIDEVLLGNIHMNEAGAFYACDAFESLEDEEKSWPRGDYRLCPVLPGAKKLLAAARGAGLEVFFVSGRRESIRGDTCENLVRGGLVAAAPAAERLVLLPVEAADGSVQPFKEEARRRISADFYVVANVGDQASDLGRHGEHQVLLPHPFYFTR